MLSKTMFVVLTIKNSLLMKRSSASPMKLVKQADHSQTCMPIDCDIRMLDRVTLDELFRVIGHAILSVIISVITCI